MAHEILVPRFGWSMETGTFLRWLKADGETVRRGEPLFELEGDKAIQEVESLEEGILRIPPSAPSPGAVVPVGAVVGYVASPGEPPPWEAQAGRAPAAPPVAQRAARELVPTGTAGTAGTGTAGTAGTGTVWTGSPAARRRAREQASGRSSPPAPAHPGPRRRASPIATPRARRAARELGIDWRELTGSGAGGRIREADVRGAAAPAAAPRDGGRGQPLSARRKTIATRLQLSHQQTVPVTLTRRADATELVRRRQAWRDSGQQAAEAASASATSDPLPSYQDMVISAVAELLERHPRLASRWEGDVLILPADQDFAIGIAVDTPDGLLVPVVRHVRRLSLGELAAETRRLAARAGAGELTAAEMQGGVFTVTNLGAWGIEAFTPVINWPESAILGLGAIRREAVVREDGRIEPRHQLTLSLTFDHRVLDGAPAARFLADLAALLEEDRS